MNLQTLTALGLLAFLGCSSGTPTSPPPSKEYLEGQAKAREEFQTKPRDWVNGYRDAVNQRDAEEAEAKKRERRLKDAEAELEHRRKSNRDNEEKRTKQRSEAKNSKEEKAGKDQKKSDKNSKSRGAKD